MSASRTPLLSRTPPGDRTTSSTPELRYSPIRTAISFAYPVRKTPASTSAAAPPSGSDGSAFSPALRSMAV